MAAMGSNSMVTQMESVLSATLTDLHTRNEVGGCIQTMLLDIETTHHLQQQLELESAQKLLEKAQTEHQGVILEAHTERLERYDRRLDLADHFVVELLQVNQQMKELLAWKETHEYKVRNYDAVLAKLSQTEEELQEANRVSFGGGAKPRRVEETTKSKSENSNKVVVGSSSSSSPSEIAENSTASTSASASASRTKSTPEETPENTIATTTIASSSSNEITTQIEEVDNLHRKNLEDNDEDQKKPPAVVDAVVSIDVEADIKEDVPTLLTLDVEPLMMVFGFLDAMDILNTAQINITMYNQVDNIFGISEDGQSPPAPTPSKPAAPPKTTAKTTPGTATSSSSSTTTTTTTTTSTTTNSTKKPAPQKGTSAASTGGVEPSSAATGVMGKGLFSMLQPAKPAPVPETTMSSAAKSSGQHQQQQQQQQSQPLSAKVAQSMASKLSDAELAAIISMTDKLSKFEKEVHMLRNEKEVFAAKLDGTEAVKQFLIGKVRDVEVKLNRSKEDEIKVTQQIASDQEVIAFLDSRVQELEQQTEDLTLEKTGTQAGFDDLKVSTSKKITMLSDMLKYEREKVREDEGDWKTTKKVLVKEVKSCRAQILALQAERDGLKEQNDSLKRAIVSTGGGGGSNSSGKHHSGSSNGGRKSSI